MIFLIGAKQGISTYVVEYVSRLVLLVYKDPETDTKYVLLKWNEEQIDIRDCEGLCEYSQFIALLEVYEELGGDLKEFCATDEKASNDEFSTSSDV